jgi:DNA-binding transcriptional MerR regulator/effector-binding domain-containing protein
MSGPSLLRIGPFSRASYLSIKALRAYHEAGLLVPAAVDPQTGYRSYSVAQLTDAAVIRRLRQLDLPLDAIRDVLDARDPVVTRKVLAEHGAALEQRLAAMQNTIDQLYAALDAPAGHTPVHLRDEPARILLTLEGTVSEAQWLPFLDQARARLREAATVSGAVVAGPFGGCYPPLMDDDHQEVVAFLPVEDPPLLPEGQRSAGVRVGELPATAVAVLVHQGGYDDLEDSYRTLGAWVGAEAEPVDLPVRELYLVGPPDTDDPDELRTEICWPIRSTDRPS